MDYAFTEQEKALRQEIQGFLKQELPSGWVGYGPGEEYGSEEGWVAAQQMSKKLAAKGWLTLAWPREYGGKGVPFTEHLVYLEEMFYNCVPGFDMGVGGVSWIASCLMRFGSDQQKAEHLPRIAQAEEFWCTGYSEPNAGSDLASLQCRAVEDGDGYIVNGQKIWTSAAHRAHYCWLAVRTNPNVAKHKGISVFLVDMKTPGITIRPLPNLLGYSSFNEVFFDNVHVPRSNLVGERDRGWYYVATALDYERATLIGVPAYCQRYIDQLVGYLKGTASIKQSDRHVIGRKLAELSIECEVCRLTAYRVAWMQSKGLSPTYEAAVAKNMGAGLAKRVAAAGMQILGLYGQLKGDSAKAALGGGIHDFYLDIIKLAIAGGTSEINAGIIAMRGLGLPRD